MLRSGLHGRNTSGMKSGRRLSHSSRGPFCVCGLRLRGRPAALRAVTKSRGRRDRPTAVNEGSFVYGMALVIACGFVVASAKRTPERRSASLGRFVEAVYAAQRSPNSAVSFGLKGIPWGGQHKSGRSEITRVLRYGPAQNH